LIELDTETRRANELRRVRQQTRSEGINSLHG